MTWPPSQPTTPSQSILPPNTPSQPTPSTYLTLSTQIDYYDMVALPTYYTLSIYFPSQHTLSTHPLNYLTLFTQIDYYDMVTLVVIGYELLQSKHNKEQQQEMLLVSDLNFDITTLARVYTHTELSEFSYHLAEAALLKKLPFPGVVNDNLSLAAAATTTTATTTTITTKMATTMTTTTTPAAAFALFGSKKERSKGKTLYIYPHIP